MGDHPWLGFFTALVFFNAVVRVTFLLVYLILMLTGKDTSDLKR